MVSEITGVLIVYLTVCSGTDQRKYQNSTSLAFVRRIHRWLLNFPHEGPVMWKMFPFQHSRKTFMVHQIFVRWAWYILFKFVKSLIRHLGQAIGNVRRVQWFLLTLPFDDVIIRHSSALGQPQFRSWVGTCFTPDHNLDQCWFIDNWKLRSQLQWNMNQNRNFFCQQNVFEDFI